VRGFDFARDPLNAKKPMQTPEEITAEDKAMKPKVMEAQKRLLEKRYDLTPKLDPEAKMSRGKPLPVGPTAKLATGTTWEDLAKLKPEQSYVPLRISPSSSSALPILTETKFTPSRKAL
jgi:hypothetical protein